MLDVFRPTVLATLTHYEPQLRHSISRRRYRTIRDGYVGEVLSTTLIGSAGSMGGTEPKTSIYLNDRANGANALTIAFGHTIDALCWVLGEFREVSATLETRRPTYTVAETQEVRQRDVADQIVASPA